MSKILTFKLTRDLRIPVLGIGTWQLSGAVCYNAVKEALKIGFRLIDTAEIYGNEQEIKKAIKDAKVKREDIFLVSKVWYTNLGKEDLINSCQRSLKALGVDYLDLYLIHWPNKNIPFDESFEAMQLLKERGLIKGYGVSNFTINHLRKVSSSFKVLVNQVEFHPYFNQKELKKYCDKKGIRIIAYSPLGQGQDLKDKVILKIANEKEALPSQVILAWLRQKGIIAIPRSSDPLHLLDNFKSLNLSLTEDEINEIDNIKYQKRLVNPYFAEFED